MEVQASTEISAPASAVWTALTDFARYADWNPFIRRARGSARPGDDVHVRVRSSFGLPLAFRARVLDSDENHALHWRGHVLAPWLACGEHWFAIEPAGDGRVRFVQRERFTGLLPWLGARLLARETRRGFEAMNEALARRVTAPR
ncbi:MAG: SRPBCC domain-containing protein [Myxococcales bacterium]|nr:SRPBCC domain-containing protein [Myxococcales bacterium]